MSLQIYTGFTVRVLTSIVTIRIIGFGPLLCLQVTTLPIYLSHNDIIFYVHRCFHLFDIDVPGFIYWEYYNSLSLVEQTKVNKFLPLFIRCDNLQSYRQLIEPLLTLTSMTPFRNPLTVTRYWIYPPTMYEWTLLSNSTRKYMWYTWKDIQ